MKRFHINLKARSWRERLILLACLFVLSGSGPWAHAQEGMGGVGIILDLDPQDGRSLLAYSVSYKSPADKVKIRRGDRLLKVDGVEVTGMSLQEVAKKIQGPIGSTVTLTIQSQQGMTQDFALVRAAISQGPVLALPPPGQAAPAGFYFTPQEKAILKQKILGLSTDEKRESMLNLLKALKEKKITKQAFMKFLQSDF